METEIEIQHVLDPLAKFREVAAENPRSKMSEAAVSKLRAVADQNKIDAIDGERLKNALLSIDPTADILGTLITRCQGRRYQKLKDGLLLRQIKKLGWWIAAGYKLGREIDTVTLINFFSELTPEEARMTDTAFSTIWDAPSAKKRLQSRITREIIKPLKPLKAEVESPEPGKPLERRCSAGAKCFWAKRGKAAPVKGKKAYCTVICQHRPKAPKAPSALAGIRTEELKN